ncbi:MAG: SulP family inorganic anion transporter, partial [Verrucomicrobiota bacterium]
MARLSQKLGLMGRRIKKILTDILRYSQLDPFPIAKSAQGYKREYLPGDLKAALNVALLAFPQGMAYAVIAGLPIEYGIYGSAIAAIIGPVFSGSRFIMLGPTNATSVLLPVAIGTLAVTIEQKLTLVPLLLIMAGLVLILGAVFRVANLTQYISRSVVTGYITAAAFYIIVNQIKKVFGLDFEKELDATLVDVIYLTVTHFNETHVPSLVLGLTTAALYMLLQRFLPALPNVALTLLAMSFVGFGMDWVLTNVDSFRGSFNGSIELLYAIDASQWRPTLPTLDYNAITELAGPAFVIAFLCILEGSSIGKSLAARAGEKLNTNQEMFAMGIANLTCGFGGGMPASGSLTRSKLNDDTGARTPFASIFCGILCIIGA